MKEAQTFKDSNGQIIEAGDRCVYCTKNGGMCDVDIVEREGELWGCGPFTEYFLEEWLSALDFDYIEIVGKTSDIMRDEIFEATKEFLKPIESNSDDDLPF